VAKQRPASSDHEDPIVGKAFDRDLMRRLLRYALPYKGPMALAFLVLVVVTVCGLAGPFVIKEAIDGPLSDVVRSAAASSDRTGSGQQLLVYGGIFLGVSVLLLALRFVQGIVMAWIGQRVMYDLRVQLYGHLIRMPFAYYDRNPVGRLVTRITSDIEALNELFASGIISFLADVFLLIGIATALLLVNPTLALVTLGVVPLLLIVTFIFRAKARRFYREQRGHLSHLNAVTQETIQGMSIVQAFHREDASERRYRKINRRYMDAFMRSVMAYSVYFPSVEILSTVALCAVIWQGGVQLTVPPATLTFGEFYLFWFFVGRFFQPIRDMAERYNVLQSAMAAAERVFEVLDTSEALVDRGEPRRVDKLEGDIEFEHVWFAYKDDKHVLRDVSFTVEAGQMVAIAGATGAGKSTIINLMSRFYDPQRGAVMVDGVNLRDFDRQDLRRRIGVVLQDTFLFSRSVRENIRLDSDDISEERLRECARQVNASRFIDRLEGGYDEILAERGRTLSVGEKQLLVFARALAHDPDILVLDEATAHVDSATERLIQDALTKLLDGRTSVVIAHRLSTIQRADKIIVLHKGELRETGTHEELTRLGGIYRRLHELQYLDGER